MSSILWFVAGIIVGVFIGIVLIALVSGGRDEDYEKGMVLT